MNSFKNKQIHHFTLISLLHTEYEVTTFVEFLYKENPAQSQFLQTVFNWMEIVIPEYTGFP